MAASMLSGHFSTTIDVLSKMADTGQLMSLSIQAQQQSQALREKARIQANPALMQQMGYQAIIDSGQMRLPLGF
jgi:DNA-binding SARP family transcriptional activator